MHPLSPLQIKTGLRVAKPANEVFEAIVDPGKMSRYFIARGSGRMDENAMVEWTFPEMEASFPVQVKKTEKINTLLLPGMILTEAKPLLT